MIQLVKTREDKQKKHKIICPAVKNSTDKSKQFPGVHRHKVPLSAVVKSVISSIPRAQKIKIREIKLLRRADTTKCRPLEYMQIVLMNEIVKTAQDKKENKTNNILYGGCQSGLKPIPSKGGCSIRMNGLADASIKINKEKIKPPPANKYRPRS